MQDVFIPPHNTIAPDTIAWFPPSVWLMLILLGGMLGLIYAGLAWWRYRKCFAARSAALTELDKIYTAQASTLAANAVLKRVSRTYYPDHINLYGEKWVAFWVNALSSKQQQTIAPVLNSLQDNLYASPKPLSGEQYRSLKACLRYGCPTFSWWRLRLVEAK
jgi:hypothetical protein